VTEHWPNLYGGATFELSRDQAGRYRFNLRTANGDIIVTSQGYETKTSAEKAIESVKRYAAGARVVDLTE
jgi:uncharacterized protein